MKIFLTILSIIAVVAGSFMFVSGFLHYFEISEVSPIVQAVYAWCYGLVLWFSGSCIWLVQFVVFEV